MEDKLMSALCHTLLYSLWQGIVLALIGGLVIISTKKYSPTLRYNLLTGALALFAVVVTATFAMQFKAVSTAGVLATDPSSTAYVVPVAGFTEKLSRYLNTYHNSIVLVWFLVICIKSIQLGIGLNGIHRLRRLNVFSPGVFWESRVHELAGLLGVKQVVSLLESGLVKVPVMIGNLKPVILFPVGLLTSLSTAEVEAILVHELAHIRRRDYLAGILQSFMEIIFFFNPAVLWISALIKTERENCCDDLALNYTRDKSSYIKALLSCEKYQAAVPHMAMAFPGNKGSLINRVKRMVTNRNYTLNGYEKAVLTIGLVLFGLCFSAFKERETIKRSVAMVVSAVHRELQAISQPSAKPQNQRITTSKKPATTDTLQQRMPDTNRKTYAGPYANLYPAHKPTSAREPYRSPYLEDSLQRRTAQQPYSPPYAGRGGYNGPEWKRQDSLANATITADLLRDHILPDDRNVVFKLSAQEFIVNGQQQSAAIFQRYRDKYVPSGPAGVGWTWNHSEHKN